MDPRFEQLNTWLASILQRTDYDINPASSDASFRRYFRVRFDEQTLIVMDAPPDKENSHPFIEIATYLESMGVNAPHVLSKDFTQGFFLLSDLGQQQYLEVLNKNNADELYQDALHTLQAIQLQGKQFSEKLPLYNKQLLLNEMLLFQEWYLARHLDIKLTKQQHEIFFATHSLLIDSALQQPQVFVHRDYHSRNLMYIRDEGNPGVLDFQDAVYGPVTYDLVSLLRDCYIAWPDEVVEKWVFKYLHDLQKCDMCKDVSERQFLMWFDWMGVQRHLKATGIFARLNYRDNKPGYLGDIPRTLGYVLSVTGKYEELAEFNVMLHELGIFKSVDQVQ